MTGTGTAVQILTNKGNKGERTGYAKMRTLVGVLSDVRAETGWDGCRLYLIMCARGSKRRGVSVSASSSLVSLGGACRFIWWPLTLVQAVPRGRLYTIMIIRDEGYAL